MIEPLEADRHIGIVGPVTNACGNEAALETSYRDLEDMLRWADDYTTAHRNDAPDNKVEPVNLIAADDRSEAVARNSNQRCVFASGENASSADWAPIAIHDSPRTKTLKPLNIAIPLNCRHGDVGDRSSWFALPRRARRPAGW